LRIDIRNGMTYGTIGDLPRTGRRSSSVSSGAPLSNLTNSSRARCSPIVAKRSRQRSRRDFPVSRTPGWPRNAPSSIPKRSERWRKRVCPTRNRAMVGVLRGEVRRADLSPVRGHEQAGSRPARLPRSSCFQRAAVSRDALSAGGGRERDHRVGLDSRAGAAYRYVVSLTGNPQVLRRPSSPCSQPCHTSAHPRTPAKVIMLSS
jgi:hypothetical protein